MKWSERDQSAWTLLRIIGIALVGVAVWAVVTASMLPTMTPDLIQHTVASSSHPIADEAVGNQEVSQP